MREIKFRAWFENDNHVEMLYEDKTGDVFQWQREGQPIKIMQYTGLKDKNGKKIYEEDILLSQAYSTRPYSQFAKSKRFKVVVKYLIDKKGGKSGFTTREIEKRKNYRYGQWGAFFDCEVIGNIYENPELLNEQRTK